jgi:hypothetical protein
MNEDLLYLTIHQEAARAYRFTLAHPDAVMMALATGCENSIASVIRAAFREIPVGEKIYACLTMCAETSDWTEADMPRPRRADGYLAKGSDRPDYEKAARFLLGRIH